MDGLCKSNLTPPQQGKMIAPTSSGKIHLSVVGMNCLVFRSVEYWTACVCVCVCVYVCVRAYERMCLCLDEWVRV